MAQKNRTTLTAEITSDFTPNQNMRMTRMATMLQDIIDSCGNKTDEEYSLILDGSGVPAASLGSDGDFYIDNDNGFYYKKASGAWTYSGSLKGPAGADGSVGTDGNDGADGTNGTNGTDGADGADGSQILTGTGVPASGTGVDSDFYLNNSNGDYYKKASGTWTLQGNLKGPAGADGADGTNGTNGTDGNDGAAGADGADGTNGTNGTDGADGTNGTDGADGADGSQILTGTGVPASGTGSDGDFYLNNSNGDYYTKASSTWTLQGNLTGPAGADGADGTNGTNGTDGNDGAAGADGADGTNGTDGADGADGSQILTGTGVPASGTGVDSDFYLNNSNGDYYKKASGTWTLQGNLKGPAGADGADGTNGTNGTDGADGAQGPAGADGTNGTNGTDGADAPAVMAMAVSDETTDLSTGNAKLTFRMPYAMTLSAVRASLTTAPTGSVLTIDINKNGTSILSTLLTIDASEKTSVTAATAAVISTTALGDDDEITIDIDTVGSTVAGAGLKVYLKGTAV